MNGREVRINNQQEMLAAKKNYEGGIIKFNLFGASADGSRK